MLHTQFSFALAFSLTTVRQNARQYNKTGERTTVRQNGRQWDRFSMSLSRPFCRTVSISPKTVRQNGRHNFNVAFSPVLSHYRSLAYFFAMSQCRYLVHDSLTKWARDRQWVGQNAQKRDNIRQKGARWRQWTFVALSPVVSLSRPFCRTVALSYVLLFCRMSCVFSHYRGRNSNSEKYPISATIVEWLQYNYIRGRICFTPRHGM